MKILFAASEAAPFAASGGLADVAGSLPREIRRKMHACRVVMPLYSDIDPQLRSQMKFVASFTVYLSWRSLYCGVFEANYNGVIYYFLDNEYYFKRPGLYGYYDDGERFAFFSKAILEMLHYIDFDPDIIHCNDWQTALVPVYLNVFFRGEEKYRNIKTVLTLHNIQYQGKYGLEMVQDVLGLPQSAASMVEYDGYVNYLKGGIDQCDMITTVSPTYSREILDPWYSHGLDGILRDCRYKLVGILNGIDVESYDPASDPDVAVHYSASDPGGKAENKRILQQISGLPQEGDICLLGIVSRLADHKGFDLVKYIGDELLQEDIQVVVLGAGEYTYESFFEGLESRHPDKLSFVKGFVPPLARKIYAGADAFLMPSKSEPCGLSQMVALRDGTIPIVRSTGGLSDSIKDLGGEDGNGFTFQSYNAHDMLNAVKRALWLYEDKGLWSAAVRHAMECDFSWNRSAEEYIRLYQRVLQGE